MNPAWGNLPNAKYIDKIINHLRRNSKHWTATSNTLQYAQHYKTWEYGYNRELDTAMSAVLSHIRDNICKISNNSNLDDAWKIASGAILALIRYDDSAYILNEELEYVHLLSIMGNKTATLLYPARLALQHNKKKKATVKINYQLLSS